MLDGSTAQVDMETEEGARMLAMYGKLDIDGVSCPLDPCFYLENQSSKVGHISCQNSIGLTLCVVKHNKEPRRNSDWICTACNTMNFARRHECFQVPSTPSS